MAKFDDPLYHCFSLRPFMSSNGYEHQIFEDPNDPAFKELVKKNYDPDNYSVQNLKVIYGHLCEFEEVTRVTEWRIKESE